MGRKQLSENPSSKEGTALGAVDLKEITYQRLTDENLKSVYELFKRNETFYSIPLEFFRRGTLGDEAYDPDLALVLPHPDTHEPIAAFIAVVKKGWVRKNC